MALSDDHDGQTASYWFTWRTWSCITYAQCRDGFKKVNLEQDYHASIKLDRDAQKMGTW